MSDTVTQTRKWKTADLVYIAMFAVLIAVCSWISIPAQVPFTMQTFGIFLTGATLGGKRGSLAVLVYLLLGAVGMPVFAGFQGGVSRLFGSTGGYILGFLLTTLLMWGMEVLFGKKTWVLLVSMVLGLLLCYAFGTIWFLFLYTRTKGTISLLSALTLCVFPYVLPDLLKIALALTLYRRLSGIIKIHS